MHAAIQSKPDRDLILTRSGTDVVFTMALSVINPNCGMTRDLTTGNVTFTGSAPTEGVLTKNADDDYEFRSS